MAPTLLLLPRPIRLLRAALARLAARRRRRTPRLPDIRDLPRHVRRDIGLGE